jgi:hypothetical protein
MGSNALRRAAVDNRYRKLHMPMSPHSPSAASIDPRAAQPRGKRLAAALLAQLLAPLLLLAALMAMAAPAAAQNGTPDALRARYAALGDKLKNNQFGRALYLESLESPSSLKGDVFATVDYPFDAVDAALNNPGHWCDVLILHLNIKYCRNSGDPAAPLMSVNLGKKTPQELNDTYHVVFKYHGETSTPDYFSVILSAGHGPLNTSDYRINLEAVAIDDTHTFLHLTYSYTYGFAGKMAMKAYLATAGSDKIGFTRTDGGGKPAYVSGVRGVVERNTMRYYLAIDAYLSAMHAPPAEQFEKRLQAWFNATERYPRQLHELDRGDYLEMKRAEYQRQNAAR